MLTGDRDSSDDGLLWVDTAHIIPEATNRNIRQEGENVGVCDALLLPTQEARRAIRFWGCLDDPIDVH